MAGKQLKSLYIRAAVTGPTKFIAVIPETIPLTSSCTDDSEPRRSGRATKGQYTKDRDIPEEAGGKKKGKGKVAKAKAVEEEVEDNEEELIRCICGVYDEEEERDMICCDKCTAWQHNDCMLLPFTSDNAPEQYFCEQCRPEDHKELLAAIARGEKPWEEVARKREEAKHAKKKKGGKRGRKSGGRPSEVKAEEVVPQKAETASPAPTSGQKRKLEETATVQTVSVYTSQSLPLLTR